MMFFSFTLLVQIEHLCRKTLFRRSLLVSEKEHTGKTINHPEALEEEEEVGEMKMRICISDAAR